MSSSIMEFNVFMEGGGHYSSGRGEEEDDEEALKWAALEKLPTYTRCHHGMVQHMGDDGNLIIQQLDLRQMGINQRRDLMDRIIKVAEQDNGHFLLKLRQRIERVGIDLPKIEVRFQNLQIDADVYVGSRALPTLTNFMSNIIEEMLSSIHLLPSRKKQLNILNNLSGIVKPSRITLLLGPPSSGKSTLLLALTGKLDSQLRVKGEVTYNGHKLSEFVPERTSAYISQHDTHMGQLTVRETLDFAAQCQGVGSRYDMLTELLHREKEASIKPDPDIDTFMKGVSLGGQKANLVTDYILKILGLDVCADTYVGDPMHQGISGGQKKRVTTGEMLVGPALAFFMDEISTGLDSSTTYQIIKCLQQIARALETTMVISLLQPAPETFDLFDDIILLSEGRIVYQGPRELVLDFFEYMGFKCPERKGVADFLQEVTSRKDQYQYWMNKEEPYRYIEVREFAERFESFHIGQRLAADLSLPYEKSRSHPAALASSHYGIGKWELLKACFSREWILVKRNSFLYVFKTVQITVVAAFTMTVFLRTEMHQDTVNDGNKYLGALFFGLINVMFNGFAEISMTIFRLPVFYKQRNMLFYPAWAYSLPIWVVRIPLSFLEAGIWVVLTYYTIGFASADGRFFRQFMILFFTHQMALGLFRVIGCTGRTMAIANTFGSFSLLVVFVFGGFIVSRNDIPKWWIWGYWISPMQYAENAIAVNELLDPRWSTILTNATESIGVTVLKSRGLFARGYWFWIGLAAMVCFGFFFNILSTLALSYLDPIEKPDTSISEEDYKKNNANLSEGSSKPSLIHGGPGSTPLIQLSGVSNLHSQDGRIAPQEGDHREARMNSNKGMVLPFQPLSMSFNHLNYYVAMPPEMKNEYMTEDRLQLLQNVSGCFRAGVLTALMGVSGAGKTTLMDVLAGRKTGGWIEGNISISGYPKQQKTFARIAGYCEQNDIHSPHITVEESLIFSAWLRLSSDVDSKTRKMFVDEVMELVELDNLRGAIVGIPGVHGLSTEQRKRLTIAVELVANPSLIFLDEPTSGLDARSAAIVMRAVRNTVNTGRTVVCTIHQPSIDIFETFDEILLLKRGGQTIYAGPMGAQSCHLIEYFQGIPGVPEMKEGINPATWMMDVTSSSYETRLQVDFADIYQNSDLSCCMMDLVKDLSTPGPESKELSFPTTYAQSHMTQILACLWKQNRSYWHNPLYNVVRTFFTVMTSFIIGSIFWDMGMKRGSQQEIFNIMGSMYASALFLGALNHATSVQLVTSLERTVYYREKAAGMYSALPFALGQVFIEIPYVLLQAILYTVIVYPMIGYEWAASKVIWFLFFSFFTFLYFTYFGMMIVSLSPNFETAAILKGAILVVWNLFSGFLIPQLSIPVWWRWYYWATPLAWTLYGFCGSQLSDITQKMNDGVLVKDFLEQYFGFHYDMLPIVAVMHLVFTVVFAFVFAFCIKHLNFQRR